MRKITAILLILAVFTGLFGCGSDKPDPGIDLEKGSIGGLSLGMSVDEAKESGVFDPGDLEEGYYLDDNETLYCTDVSRGNGVKLLDEDCDLDMYFIGGKMVSATFTVNTYMDERNIEYSQRDEFFNEKSALVENSLQEKLGEPTYENKTALLGGIYPDEGDKEAVRTRYYLVKNGKLIVPSEKISGKEFVDYVKNADYDYVITSFCSKAIAMSEDELKTNSYAGNITVQIATKEFNLMFL